MDNMQRLANVLRELENGQKRFQTPQLAYSSLEDGNILEHDADGQVVSSWGKQYDGTHNVVVVAGPTPPTPVPPQVSAIPGAFEVRWNGKFVGDEVSPLDLKHISVHLSQTSGAESFLDQKATIRGELGDVATILIPQEGTYYVRLVAWSLAGKASSFSEEVEVRAVKFIDTQTVDELLSKVDGVILEAGQLGEKLDQNTADLAANKLVVDDLKNVKLPAVEQSIADARTEVGQINTNLGGRLTTAENSLTDAKNRLTTAEGRVNDAFVQIDTAKSSASSAQTAASNAQTAADAAKSAADAAKSTADTAKTDAATAAGIAGGKADVLIQSTTPAAAMQKSTTLWIDTTSSTNKPKRWNGTAWIIVTDKAATDAATAAASAQSKADSAATAAAAADSKAQSALTAAGSAQSTADSALTMAGSKSVVFYSTSAPSGTGVKVNDLWRRIDASKNVIGEWYWTGSAWQSSQITTTMISNLDVGKLTAGSGVIADLVAQSIAASTAAFQTVDVKNLFATTGTMTEAVINKLWADVVMSRKITTNMLLVSDGQNFATIDPAAGYVDPARNAIVDSDGLSWLQTISSQAVYVFVSPRTDGMPFKAGDKLQFTATAKANVRTGVTARIWAYATDSTGGTAGNTSTASATFYIETTASQVEAEIVIPDSWKTRNDKSYVVGIQGVDLYGKQVSLRDISVLRKATGKVIVDGSIDAVHINASEALSAKVGQFLTVNTDQLVAATGKLSQAVIDKLWTEVVNSRFITTEMLAVGSFDNLNGDPRYELNSFWTGLSAGPSSGFVDPITPNAPDNPTRLILMNTKTTVTSNMSLYSHGFTTKNRIPVTPGDAYVCWSYAYSDVADPTMTTVSQQVYFYDAAGAMLSGSSGNMSAGSIKNSDWVAAAWNKVGGNPLIVPAGAAYMSPRLTVYKPASSSAATAVKYYVGPPHFTRAADGQIVVDGAIDGKTVTGALLQTDNGTNKGIKFSKLFGISAFNDTSGERTFYVDPVSGDVTMRGKFYSGSDTGVATFIDDTANGLGYSGMIMQVTPTRRASIKVRSGFSQFLEPVGSLVLSSAPSADGATDDATLKLAPGTGSGAGIRLEDGQGQMIDMTPGNGFVLQSTIASKPIDIRNLNKTTGDFTSGLELLGNFAKVYGRSAGSSFGPYMQDLTAGGISAGLKTSNGSGYFQVNNMWTTTSAANCFVNTSGTLYRSTSSAKNKLAIEDLSADRDDLILSLRARTWFDRQQSEDMAHAVSSAESNEVCENENLTELRRIPGMVAEEVEAAGLTEFVQYGTDGEVEGLMYDRLGVALIPIVARQRDRIDDLERRLQALES